MRRFVAVAPPSSLRGICAASGGALSAPAGGFGARGRAKVGAWPESVGLAVAPGRRLSSSNSDSTVGEGRPPKAQAVDTSTALDALSASRRVEKRIEEHLREIQRRDSGDDSAAAVAPGEAPAGAGGAESAPAAEGGDGEAAPAVAAAAEAGGAGASSAAASDRSTDVASDAATHASSPSSSSTAPVRAKAPEALRLVDPNAAPAEDQGGKEVILRSGNTTGQVLWPATQEDIEILSKSKLLYPAPYEVEGSVIIRLVRLSDPVTSPVGRVVRNRQFGIRGNEKWQLLAMGFAATALVYGLGWWQLRRMEWKKQLIEMRRTRLAMPRVPVPGSPFPWTDKVQDYIYRIVEVRGVFDHSREMHIGPRPGTDADGGTVAGYLCVTPLRLEDGSTVLVNRGHLPADRVDRATRPEVPTWVRVRGILEEGEVPNLVGEYARLKNRPDRNLFVYLIADELAENSGARNHEECKQALITATDVLYEDDFKAGYRREFPFVMRHKEDYLLFWADEHTHFNYACQWFAMGTLLMSMTIYKFIEVVRWRY